MDLDLLTTQQIVVIIALWIVMGAGNDITKQLLSILNKSLSSLPFEVANRSREWKGKVQGRIDATPLSYKEKEKKNAALSFLGEVQDALANAGISLQNGAKNAIAQVTNEHMVNIIDGGRNITPEKMAEIQEENSIAERYKAQKIAGALIEFAALLTFLYADAAQAANTYSVLFPATRIPPFLDNITIPLVVASAGTAFILGIFIGDLLGLTHLSDWGKLKGNKRWIMGTVIVANLVVAIALSMFVALYRANLLIDPTDTASMLSNYAKYAQALVIVPLLVTTALLLRGAIGIFVLASIVLYAFSMPFHISSWLFSILKRMVDLSVVGVDFILSRFLNLALGAFDLVFTLIGNLIKGAFAGVVVLTNLIFFIPYLIVKLILQKVFKKDLIDLIQTSSEGNIDDI